MLLFTDPQRTPDIEALMMGLPRGAGVVFRAFGAADAEIRGRQLLRLARTRGLRLLVGADARLAARIGADGVHLPERLAHHARAIRQPGWMVTCAAHSLMAARRAKQAGADAAIISPAFPSASPSAGRPLGVLRLAQMVRTAGLPIYALGGINDATAPRLPATGVIGLAAVDGLRT